MLVSSNGKPSPRASGPTPPGRVCGMVHLSPRRLPRRSGPRRARPVHLRAHDAVRRVHSRHRRLHRRLRGRLHHLAVQRRLDLRRGGAEKRGRKAAQPAQRHAPLEITLGRAGPAAPVAADRLRADRAAVKRVERLEGRDERGRRPRSRHRAGDAGVAPNRGGLRRGSLRETRDPLGGTKERSRGGGGVPRVHGRGVHGRGEERVGPRDVLSELDALAALSGLFAHSSVELPKVDGGDGHGGGRAAGSRALEEGGEPGPRLCGVGVVRRRSLRVGGVPLLVQGNLPEDRLVLQRGGGGGGSRRERCTRRVGRRRCKGGTTGEGGADAGGEAPRRARVGGEGDRGFAEGR
mmetsp:Transcript_4261/g.18997  ORF Transcript_4261/g.18997 Transcript_4261/m.18997 type:complete len:349 (-) Transcript_4261:250-1296(-)